MTITPITPLIEVQRFFGKAVHWNVKTVTGYYKLQEQLLLNNKTALLEYDGNCIRIKTS